MMDSKYYLNKLYNKLYDNLLLKKKLKEKSIIKSFIDIKSNERYRLLNDSVITADNVPNDIIKDLLSNNLIRTTENINNYTITALGVWEIEKENNVMNEIILINYLDKKSYDLFENNNKLRDREKIIIFSMIASRAFSKQSSVDLKKDDNVLEAWKNIINKSADKLSSINIIDKKSKDDLYKDKLTEHPVSNLIRHSDDLPKKTKGIFTAAGKQQYYLDLYNGSIIKDNLSYLFWLIFNDLNEKSLNLIFIDDILNYCNDVAYNDTIYTYDTQEHIFAKPEYDDTLKESLRNLIFLKSKWELEK